MNTSFGRLVGHIGALVLLVIRELYKKWKKVLNHMREKIFYTQGGSQEYHEAMRLNEALATEVNSLKFLVQAGQQPTMAGFAGSQGMQVTRRLYDLCLL